MAHEAQVKMRGRFPADRLEALDAELVAVVDQTDRYYAPAGTDPTRSNIRVRRQNDEVTVAERTAGDHSAISTRTKKELRLADVRAITKTHNHCWTVRKRRRIYRLGKYPEALLHVDHLPGLGDFWEVVVPADRRDLIERIFTDVGADPSLGDSRSYLELCRLEPRAATPVRSMALLGLEMILEWIQFAAHPMTSGIVAGVALVALFAVAGAPAAVIVASLAALAFADSLADAIGVYNRDRISYSGEPADKPALRKAGVTFAIRAFSVCLLMAPFFLPIPVTNAAIVAVALSIPILALMAVAATLSHPGTRGRQVWLNIGLAILVAVASALVGWFLEPAVGH